MSAFEVKDTLLSLTDLADRVVQSNEPIYLSADGKPKAVVLNIQEFERLLGIMHYYAQPRMSLDKFQQGFRRDMLEAGYDTPEKVIELVREVKHEIANEYVKRAKPS